MAAAKINIKNIDYFKFKKIVIDGNRDDYNVCSREVKALCDSVQTLSFRDDEFDVQSDRSRFEEICNYYHQILQSKRIDPLDMRIKSGWWGDHKTGYSAGKIKPAALIDVLASKTKDWVARYGGLQANVVEKIEEKMDGPGLYVFKHKEHQCFQFVGEAENVFVKCSDKLKAAFEGSISEPLAALLVISMATDWDFYFIPVSANDSIRILRILMNDLILKHDCIWPHGLNFSLHIDSLLEVSEFRKSCLRHHWPPETDVIEEKEIDLNRLRKQVSAYAMCSPDKPFAAAAAVGADAERNQRNEDDTDTGVAKKPSKSTTSAVKSTVQQKISQSPSKMPTDRIVAASKSTPRSPAKQAPAKQSQQNASEEKKESVSPGDGGVSSSPEQESLENAALEDQTTSSSGGGISLNRSNTFTYSDSDSSENADSSHPKDKISSSKVQNTPTKQSSSSAKPSSSRLPLTSSPRP